MNVFHPFALGIWLLQQQPRLPDWPWAWLLAAGLGGLAVALRRPGPASRFAALLLALILGFAWAGWRAETRLAQRLPSALEGRDLPLAGTVSDLPQPFERGVRFTFLPDDEVAPGLSGPLLLSWYRQGEGEVPDLRPGQRWQLTVRLKRPHGNANGSGPDYEAWLLEQGIGATGYVRPAPDNRQTGQSWSPMLAVAELRQRVREHFQAILPEGDYPYGGIFTALAVGDQKAIPGDQWRTFAATGTTHLMSISGLHVTMVAGLVGFLAGTLWRRRSSWLLLVPAQRVSLWATLLAAGAYTLLAGAAIPALRTLAMIGAGVLARSVNRHVAAPDVLGFALGAVLLWDPWSVLAPGFWLSFVAVGALLLGGPGHAASRSLSWRQRVRQTLLGWGWSQWVATLATLPLLLLFFQQFSLVSPLANALAIPLVSLVVTPLALLAALMPIQGLAAAAHALLGLLMTVLEQLAAWPGALWIPPLPAPPVFLAALVGAALLLLPRGLPGRFMGACLLLPLFAVSPPRPGPGEAWVTVLDVGQGLAVAVRTAGHTLMYDSGPYYSAESDAGERIVVPWLRRQGIAQLDGLIVTHRDWDHSGGARSVLETLPVQRLLDSLPDDSPEAAVLRPLARNRAPCQGGHSWNWDGVAFTLLYPPPEKPATAGVKANHASCVLRIDAGGQGLLLTSDIEAPDEAWLLANAPEMLAAQTLVAPHHGSRTSSTAAFITAVNPQEVIFPVGYRNRFGHPKAEVVARYAEDDGRHLWRTDRQGAVTLEMGPGDSAIWAERQRFRRYWYDLE